MTAACLQLATAAAGAAPAEGAWFLWGSVLFAAALVLLVLELFVPSGGLIGILAGVCAIGSIVAFFKHDTTWGLAVVGTWIVLIPLGVAFFFKVWLNTPIGRRMILGGEAVPPDPESALAAEQARRSRLAELRALIGAQGDAETALRPVGTVRIGGRRLDAMSEFGIIEAGTRVTVTDVYDNQIKVRPCDDAAEGKP